MSQGLKKGSTLQGGTYRIEETLGQGAFGITYLAVHLRLNKKIAIKEFFLCEFNTRNDDCIMVEGAAGSVFTDFRRKFRREAENLAKLRHPNIVNVSDIFDENGTTYYVMDFIEGTSLDGYIGAKGHLSEKEAIAAIIEIGKALEYMHSKRMLHLDIKPGNVMRDADGRYFLIDFGLSKQFSDVGNMEASTVIGAGTPGYAPIEQMTFRKDGTFPATLDVYALGATMYKMLTGKRPPEAAHILNEEFPKDELMRYGISVKTINSLEKAMMPNYKKRYQNVHDFLTDLEEGNNSTDNSMSYEEDEKTSYLADIEIEHQTEKPINSPTPQTDIQSETYATVAHEKKKRHWMRPVIASTILGILILLGWIIGRTFIGDDTESNTNEQIERIEMTASELFEKGEAANQRNDYSEAAEWYLKAAELGHAGAQCNLGWMYENGTGVTRDKNESVKWFKKAAGQGEMNAQFNLGVMYENGDGVPKDLNEARIWFGKAASKGHVMAKEKLQGYSLESGGYKM